MPAARPIAQHQREGSYRADRHDGRALIAHSPLIRPDFADILPGDSGEAERIRTDAGSLWDRLAPALESSINLSDAHREVLAMFVVSQSRYWEVERQISRTSMSSVGQKGEPTRNHMFMVRSQLIAELRTLRIELGLSPRAASQLLTPADSDDTDPDGIFD